MATLMTSYHTNLNAPLHYNGFRKRAVNELHTHTTHIEKSDGCDHRGLD